jgi:hypothetical protein
VVTPQRTIRRSLGARAERMILTGRLTPPRCRCDNANTMMSEPLEPRTLLSANGSISGHVFLDTDYNGRRGGADRLARGQIVFLDTNGNGQLDKSEPSRRTNSRGGYVFSDLDAGTYRVRLVRDNGTVATRAGRGIIVQLAKDQAVTGRDLGFAPALSIDGTVRYPWGSGLGGSTVFVDSNGNGRLDAGEVSSTTDRSGAFHLAVSAPGTFAVTLAPRNAFTPMDPASGSSAVTLSAASPSKTLTFVVDGPISDPM